MKPLYVRTAWFPPRCPRQQNVISILRTAWHPPRMPDKEFTQWLDCGHIFAWRDSQNGRIVSFFVLLIAEIAGREHCVARYDTAHGTAHRDILGIKKGLLEKEWFFESSREEVFDYAIRDFQANAKEHIRFFLAH